jgi:hypothetical protein
MQPGAASGVQRPGSSARGRSLISTQKGTLRTTLHFLRGSAESVLRSQEGSGKRELSRFAREVVVIAFNARSGPIPLPHRGVAVTG